MRPPPTIAECREEARRVIVLCGIGGVGKTHARTHDADLLQWPHVDVADIYQRTPHIPPAGATKRVVNEVKQLLADGHTTVVVEGYYLPGSMTRTMLARHLRGMEVEYRLMVAPIETCIARIKASGENVKSRLACVRRTWRQHARSLSAAQLRGKTWQPDRGVMQ